MTEKKTQKNPYSLWDYPQLIDYMQKMALDGWMLTDYHEKTLEFEKSEPKQLRFAVSFFPDYVAGIKEPPEKLEKMWDFAQMDGWQHITGSYHTQVFYNEAINCPPLHTDAVVRLENYNSIITKLYLKKWKICAALSLGAYLVFTAVLLTMYFDYRATQYVTFEYNTMCSVKNLFQIYTLGEFVYNTVKLVRYKKWYKRSLETAREDNNFIPLIANNFTDKINLGISIAVIVSLMMQFFSFVWLGTLAKDAIEYMLNNPTP